MASVGSPEPSATPVTNGAEATPAASTAATNGVQSEELAKTSQVCVLLARVTLRFCVWRIFD